MASMVRLGRRRRRGVVVAKVRCAQRRYLRTRRDLIGLRASVVVNGPLRKEMARELLIARQHRHNQVGGHDVRYGLDFNKNLVDEDLKRILSRVLREVVDERGKQRSLCLFA